MRTTLAAVIALILVTPTSLFAAQYRTFEYSGWVPYWKGDAAIADAMGHLDTFTEINPFADSVKENGTLSDTAKVDEGMWPQLQASAKEKNIRYIPTIMWSGGDTIHKILSNKKTRIALEDEIAALVKEKGFDGIDIDFEGKKAATRPYFSLFLKGLYMRMGNKWVMCTIEARTPPADLYAVIPPDLEYANDFKEINKYCDRVRFMTYDQGRADIKLNAAMPHPYVPVADVQWVEKAIRNAMKDIAKKKIMIGVATYGYEYDMFADTTLPGGQNYSILWSFNPRYATELATSMGITPQRNASGEMTFSYPASDPKATTPIPLTYATRTLTWSDGEAIRTKIDLAKRLGVRGISIFKIDAGEDPTLWDVLPTHRDNL